MSVVKPAICAIHVREIDDYDSQRGGRTYHDEKSMFRALLLVFDQSLPGWGRYL
jgi:hypothetical protein